MDVKISWRLLEFAMPLLMHAQDSEEGELIIRVAAEVWNFVGEDEPDAVDQPELLVRVRSALLPLGLKIENRRLKAWVSTLIPLRALYDDPRLVQIITVDRGSGQFNISAAALLPR